MKTIFIISALMITACATASETGDTFAAIHAQCHYGAADNCEAYNARTLNLGGLLYYPNPNVLDIAALYPRGSKLPPHDTARGWSSELLRSAIVLDISTLADFERDALTRLHLKPVSARGTVHNACVLSVIHPAPNFDTDGFAPPAPLDVSCPSPNQITLYLTDVSLTESL